MPIRRSLRDVVLSCLTVLFVPFVACTSSTAPDYQRLEVHVREYVALIHPLTSGREYTLDVIYEPTDKGIDTLKYSTTVMTGAHVTPKS